MRISKSHEAFLELVRAGLWETDVRLSHFGEIDFDLIYRFAQEQSVVGLLAAGIEHIVDIKVPSELSLEIVGEVLQIERQNREMNVFLSRIINKFLSIEPIGNNILLIKGQGIAQLYERPLWRSCGDVDLLVESSVYDMIKGFLRPYSESEPKENLKTKEYCITINSWTVEIHGTLHCRLTKQLDLFLDRIQEDCFIRGEKRTWNSNGVEIPLPPVGTDIMVVFTHIVKHYFREGIGLRQICDLCRFLWSFRDDIDSYHLEQNLKSAGLLSEWKAFTEFGVEWLGMPLDVTPLYDAKYSGRSRRLMKYILQTGNFGHNRDMSYYTKNPFFIRKTISFFKHTKDSVRRVFVFPKDSIKVWWGMLVNGLHAVVNK